MKYAVALFGLSLLSAIAFIHGSPSDACDKSKSGSIVTLLNCPDRLTEKKWSF